MLIRDLTRQEMSLVAIGEEHLNIGRAHAKALGQETA